MNESLGLGDKVVGPRRAGLGARLEARAASRSVEVRAESDRAFLAGRTSLGSSLGQITSRLLDQLATSGGQTRGLSPAGHAQTNMRGNSAPWDGSSLVSWKRVIADSAGGSLLALVSLPPTPGLAESLAASRWLPQA